MHERSNNPRRLGRSQIPEQSFRFSLREGSPGGQPPSLCTRVHQEVHPFGFKILARSWEANCAEGNNDHIQPIDCCTCYTKPERRHVLFFQDEKLEAIFLKIGNSFCKLMQFDSCHKSGHSQCGTSA
ncbi:hypothetical protein E2320_000176 [Naja naja]|nr:hypothetical protein E2320_000176 [Naja naja]